MSEDSKIFKMTFDKSFPVTYKKGTKLNNFSQILNLMSFLSAYCTQIEICFMSAVSAGTKQIIILSLNTFLFICK